MRSIETLYIKQGEALEEAARLLREGGLVAFPTETVYGLGANALDEQAVKAIYEAKGRPSDNPLIVHICPGYDLSRIAKKVPEKALKLMEAFWPGPLTMSFEKTSLVPDRTTGGLSTVGVRMPSHPVAMGLIRLSVVPVAAPSANRSGRPSPTTFQHVREDMDGRVHAIIDGGDCQVGLESTFLDMSREVPMILRPGVITREMIEDVIGPVEVEPSVAKGLAIAKEEHPRSPGMKYRHYAPKGDMVLLRGSDEAKKQYLLDHLPKHGEKTGWLVSEELFKLLEADAAKGDSLHVELLGSRQDPEEMNHRLFAALRRFDDEECDKIYGEAFSNTGTEMALMNRLLRAAAGQILNV